MHILLVTSEVAPFSGSDGPGELVGTLARSLREAGVSVTVLTPFYSEQTGERFGLARRIRKILVPVGNGKEVEIGLLDGKFPSSDVQVVCVDHPQSYLRDGLHDTPHPDDHLRFNLLCRSAPRIADELGLDADVVHSFDWQAGLLPLLLRRGEGGERLARARSFFSVHDASIAGLFDQAILAEIGLGPELFTPEALEFHGRVSLLKAGLIGADAVCVASPSYAREIQTEPFGCGLHGLFAALGDRLHGVMNGIDYATWDPNTDHRIPQRYDVDSIEAKTSCKHALQAELELPARPQMPLAVMFAPLTGERGFDLLLQSLPQLQSQQLQLVLVGGDGSVADRLASLPQPFLGVARQTATDADSTHRVLAAADAVLMPFKHDPGGALQLKALRYGAVPVATPFGGLRDCVVDFDGRTATGTGIAIHRFDVESLVSAMHRLVSLYTNQKKWEALTRNAMRQQFSMQMMARRYIELYEGAVGPTDQP